MGTGGMEVDPGVGPESSGLQTGVVTLLHNVIIAGDEQRRVWFAQYLKCMQQKVHTSTNGFMLREIVRELGMINSCLTILVRCRLCVCEECNIGPCSQASAMAVVVYSVKSSFKLQKLYVLEG